MASATLSAAVLLLSVASMSASCSLRWRSPLLYKRYSTANIHMRKMILRMICHIFFSRLPEHERRTPGHNIGKARLGCIHSCFQRWNTGNNGSSISRTYQKSQGKCHLWHKSTRKAYILLPINKHILTKTEPYGSLHSTILKDDIPCQVVGCHDKRNGLCGQRCTHVLYFS